MAVSDEFDWIFSVNNIEKEKSFHGHFLPGYVLPAVVPRYYPTFGATVLVGYPLLTGGYGGYGGVIPHYLGYGYGR
jgi:hypothetical protein